MAAPFRSLSALNSRASLFRAGSCVVSRSMSNQESASGKNSKCIIGKCYSIGHCRVVICYYCYFRNGGVSSKYTLFLINI